jgi:hypothetical protein
MARVVKAMRSFSLVPFSISMKNTVDSMIAEAIIMTMILLMIMRVRGILLSLRVFLKSLTMMLNELEEEPEEEIELRLAELLSSELIFESI